MGEPVARLGMKRSVRTSFAGIPIVVEYLKGDTRTGKSSQGRVWSRKMKSAYGRVVNTKGMDRDPLDVYIGENPNASTVFVVDQLKGPEYKELDEQKFMLGYDGIVQAKEKYLENYPDNRVLGRIRPLALPAFIKFVTDKASKAPSKVASRKDNPMTSQFVELNLARLSEGLPILKRAADESRKAELTGQLVGVPAGTAVAKGLQAIATKRLKMRNMPLLPFVGMTAGPIVGGEVGRQIAEKRTKKASADLETFRSHIKTAAKDGDLPKSVFENRKARSAATLGATAVGTVPVYLTSKHVSKALVSRGVSPLKAGVAGGVAGLAAVPFTAIQAARGATKVTGALERDAKARRKEVRAHRAVAKTAGLWGSLAKGFHKTMGSAAFKTKNIAKAGVIGTGSLGLYGGYRGIKATTDLAKPYRAGLVQPKHRGLNRAF